MSPFFFFFNIIFGAMYDANMSDTCKVTIIATGIEEKANQLKGLGFKSAYITPTSLQSKTAGTGMGTGHVGFGTANLGIRPSSILAGQGAGTAGESQQEGVRPIAGINRATDIKSSVEEKSLKIPDFLQRK